MTLKLNTRTMSKFVVYQHRILTRKPSNSRLRHHLQGRGISWQPHYRLHSLLLLILRYLANFTSIQNHFFVLYSSRFRIL